MPTYNSTKCNYDSSFEEVDQPEIIDHLETCSTCSLLPTLDDQNLTDGNLGDNQQGEIINSLSRPGLAYF